MDDVCDALCADDGPWMAGLVGRSGAGKTTAAAAIVGDNPGYVRPYPGETRDEALKRLARVRARFLDGIFWLRIGRGAGCEQRLTSLMLRLSRMVQDEFGPPVDCGGPSPAAKREGGAATVREVVSQGKHGEGRRCLLVADDVWELEVVEKLRETGMRVLLTTRLCELVRDGGGRAVAADGLTRDEAEAVLRGAAGLGASAALPPAAHEIIHRCDHRAMYLGSVGKWESVQGRDDEAAWSKALRAIDQNVEALVAEREAGVGGDLVADRHHAILRAGYDSLGVDGVHSRLYLSLAVMPDGHSFALCEAAILLHGPRYDDDDLAQAIRAVEALERWAMVRIEATGLYRMHDARREFAREKLGERENVRAQAVANWREHLSMPDALRSVDLLTLLGMWQAVERVGGKGWRESRPYDKAVAEMDPRDESYFASVKMLAALYQVEGDLDGVEGLMLGVLERNDGRPGSDPLVVANALCWRVVITTSRGQKPEAQRLRRRMCELIDPAIARWESRPPTGGLEEVLSLHTLGSLCLTAGRIESAEVWFQRALEASRAAGLGSHHAQVGFTQQGLAHCAEHAGRHAEAEALFRRSLDIVEMRRGKNSLEEASMVSFLAACELDAHRPAAAEELFRRALEIYVAREGPGCRYAASTLHSLAICARDLGRREDAECLLKRSLSIQRAGAGGCGMGLLTACTLHELAICLKGSGRLRDAERLLSEALGIHEGMRGKRDCSQMAATLRELECLRGVDVAGAPRPEAGM